MDTPRFTRRRVEVPETLAFKWSRDVMDEGFTPFPKRLLRCLSQVVDNVRDLQVILAIADYARPNASRPPSIDYLSFVSGIPFVEFKERILQMERNGWLTFQGHDEGAEIRFTGILNNVIRYTEDESRPAENFVT